MRAMPLDYYTVERRLLWSAVLLQVLQDANRILLDSNYEKQRDMFDREPANGAPTRWDCLRALNWIVGQSENRKADRDMVCEFLGKDGDKFRDACIAEWRSTGNLNKTIENLSNFININK